VKSGAIVVDHVGYSDHFTLSGTDDEISAGFGDSDGDYTAPWCPW
jgi:hypothetical protein